MVNKDWSRDKFLGIGKERLIGAAESSGITSTNFLHNIRSYLMIIALFLVFIIILAILASFKSFLQKKIKEELKNIIRSTFFNGTIDGFTITYL